MRCVKITVTGLVQGVGYRPFVAELAESCGIGGQVKNVGGIVKIVAAGEPEALERFVGNCWIRTIDVSAILLSAVWPAGRDSVF